MEFWVINLQRRPDRLAAFRERNAASLRGIDVQVLKATDQAELTFDHHWSRLAQDSDFDYHRGALACAASHFRVWAKLVERPSLDAVVVLEDDVTLSSSFSADLDSALRQVEALQPQQWQILWLGLLRAQGADRLGASPTVVATEPSEQVHYGGGGHGYVMHRRGARFMFQRLHTTGMLRAVDCDVWACPHMAICQPSIAVQPDWWTVGLDTDIQRIPAEQASLAGSPGSSAGQRRHLLLCAVGIANVPTLAVSLAEAAQALEQAAAQRPKAVLLRISDEANDNLLGRLASSSLPTGTMWAVLDESSLLVVFDAELFTSIRARVCWGNCRFDGSLVRS